MKEFKAQEPQPTISKNLCESQICHKRFVLVCRYFNYPGHKGPYFFKYLNNSRKSLLQNPRGVPKEKQDNILE